MSWKDIAEKVGKAAPVLGGLLGGPAGATVGAIIASGLGTEATPDAVGAAIEGDPDAAIKLREIEANRELKLQEMLLAQNQAELAAEVQTNDAVNVTMREEAKSEHWPSWLWRPLIGMAVAANVFLSSFAVTYVFIAICAGSAAATAAAAQLPAALGALAALNATVLPVLGIASWFRGKKQAASAEKGL